MTIIEPKERGLDLGEGRVMLSIELQNGGRDYYAIVERNAYGDAFIIAITPDQPSADAMLAHVEANTAEGWTYEIGHLPEIEATANQAVVLSRPGSGIDS